MARLIADAGLLIAAERNDRSAWVLKRLAVDEDRDLIVPAPVLAQVWRGRGSANLARYLRGLTVAPLDDSLARAAGELCGISGTRDVCDAAVVACARAGDVIVTGDPADIANLVRAGDVAVGVRQI